jgi:hypothetical protein
MERGLAGLAQECVQNWKPGKLAIFCGHDDRGCILPRRRDICEAGGRLPFEEISVPILVACECGKTLRVKDELEGKRIRCPDCQSTLTVPAPDVAIAPKPKSAAPKTKPVLNIEEEDEERPKKRKPPDDAIEEKHPKKRKPSDADAEEGELPKKPKPHDEEDEEKEEEAERPWRRPVSADANDTEMPMRITTLLFALVAAGIAGFGGYRLYTETNVKFTKLKIQVEQIRPIDAKNAEAFEKIEMAKLRPEMIQRNASYLMMGGAGLGLVVGLLVLLRLFPKLVSVLFALPIAGPAVLEPRTLLFTAAFILPMVTGCMISSAPRAAGKPAKRKQARKQEEPEDEEE